MPAWLTYVAYFAIVFVVIAPTRTLLALTRRLVRHVRAGVLAMASLGAAIYLLASDGSGQSRTLGDAALALGLVCGAWWIYRRIVPVYREQAPATDRLADDR